MGVFFFFFSLSTMGTGNCTQVSSWFQAPLSAKPSYQIPCSSFIGDMIFKAGMDTLSTLILSLCLGDPRGEVEVG